MQRDAIAIDMEDDRVRKAGLGLVCAILCLLSTCTASDYGAADAPGIEVGDGWEYGFSDSYEFSWGEPLTINLTGTFRMNVTSEITLSYMGSLQTALVLTVTGGWSGQGAAPNVTMTDTTSMSGRITRLASNFSLVSMDMVYSSVLRIVSDFTGVSYWNTSMGQRMDFTTPHDDYVGDADLEAFKGSECRSDLHEQEWRYDEPTDDNKTEENNATLTTKVLLNQRSKSLSVPAGTFECNVYSVTQGMGGSENMGSCYYSKEVGNYVRINGLWVPGTPLTKTNLTLNSYSYDAPSEKMDLFSGPILWILLGIAATVVVIVVVGLVAKKKRYARRGY